MNETTAENYKLLESINREIWGESDPQECVQRACRPIMPAKGKELRPKPSKSAPMRRGEVQMKVFLQSESKKHGITEQAVCMRIKRRRKQYYPGLKIRRVNARVVFVKV